MKLASELFARSQDIRLEGDRECHWCSARCSDRWRHDGPPNLPFVVSPEPAKRIANPYICISCWMWRRPKVTVSFLSGGFKDSQSVLNHSWLFIEEGAFSIRPEDYRVLYEFLLRPKGVFCLALLGSSKEKNHLQCMLLNRHDEVRADTELYFTLNNISHTYTVYELEEALRLGDSAGTEPGVQALIRHLGEFYFPPVERKVGRPVKTEDKRTKKVSQ